MMVRRLSTLLRQDARIALRHGFHYVILFLAILFVGLLNYAVPAEVKLTPTEYFADLTSDKAMETYLRAEGLGADRFLPGREALEQRVQGKENSIGIIMEGSVAEPVFTIIHQGTEAPEVLNILDATLEELVDLLRGDVRPEVSRIEYLRPPVAPIPFNQGLVPVVLSFEVVLLGFMLVAVLVFQEKQEGSIRAYRVSPGGTLEYILAKTGVNVLLSVLYSLLIVPFTLGLGVNYPSLLALVVLVSLLMTLVGLATSVFFNNISEFLFLAVGLILAVFMLPIISYFFPSFAPSFLTWIPSFPAVFGAREILFPTGKTGYLTPLLGMLLAESAFFLAAAYVLVGRKLMKEGR